ncbi:hypothetical protein BDB01DRAFT_908893 [Pilobolus umbonatus]|nr:hypothetical protein BDB01DRAFT_908893 [Pilobolus umbonatus]
MHAPYISWKKPFHRIKNHGKKIGPMVHHENIPKEVQKAFKEAMKGNQLRLVYENTAIRDTALVTYTPVEDTQSAHLSPNDPPRMKRTATVHLTRAVSKGQVHLKRAVTWLGQQRLFTSHALFTKRPMENIMDTSHSTLSTDDGSFIEDPVISDVHAFETTSTLPKRIMYCRVMQIVNTVSSRDCDYNLDVHYNQIQVGTQQGVLRKIGKNSSGDRPQDVPLVFDIQEPFSLEFIVSARHSHTMVRNGLAKIGISHPLPIVGKALLQFENKMDVLDQGVSKLRVKKIDNALHHHWIQMELLIDIRIEEVAPPIVHHFPWSYPELSDSLFLSQSHCQQGDYLTIYTRGLAHPTWKRYWACLVKKKILLYDFTYKDEKDPLCTLYLQTLQSVSKPSLDDCEHFGITRNMAIMLQFDRSQATSSTPVLLEQSEVLEGKSYIYGDNEQNTVYWRRAIDASLHLPDEEVIGIDLRFLW